MTLMLQLLMMVLNLMGILNTLRKLLCCDKQKVLLVFMQPNSFVFLNKFWLVKQNYYGLKKCSLVKPTKHKVKEKFF